VKTDELGGTLYIPAVFSSMFGLSLDTKTPLLKSERVISRASIRALNLIRSAIEASDESPSEVFSTVGTEQEVFIIDRDLYNKRPDLMITGRTLFGCKPPKGQDLAEHYWGHMPMRVVKAFESIQSKMYEFGVPVATIHNEVAPAQFEIAPSFERASVSSDHNMLLMQVMEEECERKDLALLLHEKPFANVNGSGKHTNWSLATNTGENLLYPGENPNPKSNIQFLFFLAAFLKAADEHSDILRTYVAVPGNEFRLGGMEAPPAIISVFLGDHLENLVKEIIEDTPATQSNALRKLLDLGVVSLPQLKQDSSDRNRTSPMAFTGNRFEFRAVGSSQNPAGPITAMNAIMSSSLNEMCEELEKSIAAGMDKKLAIDIMIRETLKKHVKITYGGDCYEQVCYS